MVPFHFKKKTVFPGLVNAAAQSVSPTFAQSNFCIVAPPGNADRMASEEQSGFVFEPLELVEPPLGVPPEFDGEDPQAEKARTDPRTGTTARLRRARLLGRS